jgi:hypothetical protein
MIMIFSTYAKAQTWCPPGATWYYDDDAMFFPGYSKLTYVNDTTIKGKSCKKITHFMKYRDPGKVLQQKYQAPYFTYEENGVVYLYDTLYGQDKFDTLFNINAKVGDRWRVPFADPTCKDTTLIMKVKSVGTKMVNGFNLKWVSVQQAINLSPDTIVERLGIRFDLFRSINYSKCKNIIYEGSDGKLRCYSDNSFGSYSTGLSKTCDFVTGIIETKQDKGALSFYPNPANEKVNVVFESNEKNNVELKIYDLTGKLVRSAEFNKNTEIPVADLENGIYTFTCTANGNYLQSGKLSVMH